MSECRRSYDGNLAHPPKPSFVLCLGSILHILLYQLIQIPDEYGQSNDKANRSNQSRKSADTHRHYNNERCVHNPLKARYFILALGIFLILLVLVQKLPRHKTKADTQKGKNNAHPPNRHKPSKQKAYKCHTHPNQWVFKILVHNNCDLKKLDISLYK